MATRKQISFDLSTEKLKKHYAQKNWRKAYEDIKYFMLRNNFTWIQGSVYTSNVGMRLPKIHTLLEELINKYPYLNLCMRDCVVTNIGKTHNLNNLFDKEYDL